MSSLRVAKKCAVICEGQCFLGDLISTIELDETGELTSQRRKNMSLPVNGVFPKWSSVKRTIKENKITIPCVAGNAAQRPAGFELNDLSRGSPGNAMRQGDKNRSIKSFDESPRVYGDKMPDTFPRSRQALRCDACGSKGNLISCWELYFELQFLAINEVKGNRFSCVFVLKTKYNLQVKKSRQKLNFLF